MMNFTKKKLYEKSNESTNLDACLLSISKKRTKKSRFNDLSEFYQWLYYNSDWNDSNPFDKVTGKNSQHKINGRI